MTLGSSLGLAVTLCLFAAGCGHSHGSSGGASSPSSSHSSGSSESFSSSHSSGGAGSYHSSSHVSNTSYLERRAPEPVSRPSSGKSGSDTGSSGDSPGAEIAKTIAAGVIEGLAEQIPNGPTVTRADKPTHPETPCESALREFYEMHPDGAAKLPPQLRCGPNGEWGLDLPAQPAAR